jgi:phage-related protein
MLKAWWRNLRYILDHKLNVLVECWIEGLYIQGITHDLSKFSRKEFFSYAKKFFYRGEKTADNELKWKYAWLHHQRKNKHHWEYWVVDPNNKQALPMPRKYLIEMVCDWRSFSRKWGRKVKPATLDLTEKIVLHPDTKKELEMIMKRKREEDARNTASWSNYTNHRL